MKLALYLFPQPTWAILKGATYDATITTEHSASSYGKPVLLIGGDPVGTAEAELAGYRILEATDTERELLAAAGYRLKDK